MDDLISEFIEETTESLTILDSELVIFEKNPHDETILGNIFRLVHTIKGTCGFLGLPRLEAVAHAGENILGKMRDKTLDVSPEAISLVLESLDRIKELVEHLAENGAEQEGDDSELIARLNAFVENAGQGDVDESDNAATESAPSADDAVESSAEKEETAAEEEKQADEIPEDALEEARKLAEGLPKEFDGDSEEMQRIFDETPVLVPTDTDSDGQNKQSAADAGNAKDSGDSQSKAPVPTGDSSKKEGNKAADNSSKTNEKKAASAVNKKAAVEKGLQVANKAMPEKKAPAVAAQSIRVNIDVLEQLMQMVGELVLTRNQLLQLVRNSESQEFSSPIQQLSHITSELQEQVMKTRMQPIGNAWAKFPRLIRDLAMDLNKKIELRMIGAETELDRQLLEMIKDPLTHMVRNSADHGLEGPEERIAAGKPETGTITLSAFHEGGHIILEIADDGRGINVQKVAQKAIENGVATAEEIEEMSDNQIIQFIFAAGFSTAEKVTSVSGRGVGMDVVRTNIEKIGGAIELTSEEGKGSKFHIKIPLTLAIVSVLVLKAGGERFAIPQINVLELVRTTNDSSHKIEEINGSAVLRLREKLLPLITLSEILNLEDKRDHDQADSSYIVVCQVGGMEFGLIVDQIYDTEEIVVKPKSDLFKDIDIYSGTTILGDGSVIMILDPNGLTRQICKKEQFKEDDKAHLERKSQEEVVPFLLFEGYKGGLHAIPLELVARLEELEFSEVEYSSGIPVVQYRDTLMRLLTINGDALPTEGTREVIVFQYDGRIMGVVVEQILDIVEAPYLVKMRSDVDGIVGSMVINGKTTEILDVGYYITKMFGTLGNAEQVTIDRKLLFVEDSPFFRNLTVPFLEQAGFDVYPAEDAEQALELLEKEQYFDLIVTDIEMPGMDGFELAATIRKNSAYETIPIFAFTSTVSEAFLQRGKQIGFSDFIEKTNRSALIETIKREFDGNKLAESA